MSVVAQGVEELSGMLTRSEAMRGVFRTVRRFAQSDLPVLVCGETGSGKELITRAIHEASGRTGPIVVINCGALSPTLIESELFGHVKGAFTGAHEAKKGVFEAAADGTIILDEIGELPLALQPKLLRVLETLTVRRVGGVDEVAVDVRVIAATHRDLAGMVERGEFREDLFHRLTILEVRLPSLSERAEDIPLLAEHFLGKTGERVRITEDAKRRLLAHDWPGNVRELRNVMLRAHLLSETGTITEAELRIPTTPLTREPKAPPALKPRLPSLIDFSALTMEEERRLILGALEAFGNNRSKAARRLGISRSTLHERLKRYGVPQKARRELACSVA